MGLERGGGGEQPAALNRNCSRIAHRSLLHLTHDDAAELKRDFCNVPVSPQIRPSGKIRKTVTVPVGCRISQFLQWNICH